MYSRDWRRINNNVCIRNTSIWIWHKQRSSRLEDENTKYYFLFLKGWHTRKWTFIYCQHKIGTLKYVKSYLVYLFSSDINLNNKSDFFALLRLFWNQRKKLCSVLDLFNIFFSIDNKYPFNGVWDFVSVHCITVCI